MLKEYKNIKQLADIIKSDANTCVIRKKEDLLSVGYYSYKTESLCSIYSCETNYLILNHNTQIITSKYTAQKKIEYYLNGNVKTILDTTDNFSKQFDFDENGQILFLKEDRMSYKYNVKYQNLKMYDKGKLYAEINKVSNPNQLFLEPISIEYKDNEIIELYNFYEKTLSEKSLIEMIQRDIGITKDLKSITKDELKLIEMFYS